MASIIKVNEYKDFGNNDIITSDGAGTITLSSGMDTAIQSGASKNTPSFLATKANTGFSSGVAEKMQFATEVLDSDGCYDNSVNWRFTPTTSGFYYTFARVAYDNDSASDRHISYIYKNGAEVARGDQTLTGSYFQNNNTSSYVDYIVEMNGSSDYLECYGYTSQNGASKNTAGYGCFGAYKIIGA